MLVPNTHSTELNIFDLLNNKESDNLLYDLIEDAFHLFVVKEEIPSKFKNRTH